MAISRLISVFKFIVHKGVRVDDLSCSSTLYAVTTITSKWPTKRYYYLFGLHVHVYAICFYAECNIMYSIRHIDLAWH